MSALFPTQAPALYGDKTTANDVHDAGHWDGADANALKAEVVAIAAKVGIDNDPNASSHDRKIAALEIRRVACVGSGELTGDASTTVEDSRATAGSIVLVQGTYPGFAARGVYVADKSDGSFTLNHETGDGGETFDYVIVK